MGYLKQSHFELRVIQSSPERESDVPKCSRNKSLMVFSIMYYATSQPTIPFHLSYGSHAEIKSRDLTVTPTLLFNLWYTSSARGYVGVTCSCEIKSDVAVADLGLLSKHSWCKSPRSLAHEMFCCLRQSWKRFRRAVLMQKKVILTSRSQLITWCRQVGLQCFIMNVV